MLIHQAVYLELLVMMPMEPVVLVTIYAMLEAQKHTMNVVSKIFLEFILAAIIGYRQYRAAALRLLAAKPDRLLIRRQNVKLHAQFALPALLQ